MIFSLLFVGLLASAAVAERNLKPYKFTPGQTYLYDYSARLQTGIPKISDQFSNFQIDAEIKLEGQATGSDEVKLRMTNIRTGQMDGAKRTDDAVEMKEWSNQYKKELETPIVFTHQNGRVISFRAKRSEPEWSINIKKSILSLFNVNLQPKHILQVTEGNLVPKPVSQEDLKYYGVYEQGMGGECETTYEINQIPSEDSESKDLLLNVTKSRNYNNCNSRPVLFKDNFSRQHQDQHQNSQSVVKGFYPIPAENEWRKHQDKDQYETTVKQFNSVKYNISMSSDVAVIEGIVSEGRVVYNTFGDKIVAITQQNVTLKNRPEENKQLSSIDILSSLQSQKYEDLSFQLPKLALSGSQSQQAQKVRMDIPHMALFGQPRISELAKKMPEYFRTLAREILSSEKTPESKDAMQRVIEIVNTFASLPRESLEQLFKQVAEPGRDEKSSPEKQMMRKLMLDCLALAGTNDAAMLIKQKIVSHQVTSNEARELLEALPHNMFLPDVKTIDAFLELYQHPRVVNRPVVHTAAAVCFGKLVQIAHKKSDAIQSEERSRIWGWGSQNAADQDDDSRSQGDSSEEWEEVYPQKKITQQDIERYVVVAGRILDQADSFQKKVAAIEALAHMGVAEALKSLQPYLTGEAPLTVVPGYEVEEGQSVHRERDYLRTIAIYATAHIAHRFPKQVQPLVLSVYRNSAEQHQMRLAAFTILMLCQPEQHILESIATDLHRESDKQVISFVVSALKSAANQKAPCEQEKAGAAAQAAESAPKFKTESKQSRLTIRDYFDEKRSFGLIATTETIHSRRSPIPKAAYLSLVEATGQFHEQLLELGFNAKGLEKVVHRIVGRNGVIASLLQNKQSEKPQKRNMVPIEEAARQLRERISSTLNYKNSKDSARLDVFFKLFERTSIYALDEAALFDLIDDVESAIDTWSKSYANGYTGTFAKVFMPSSLVEVVPCELGLPIVVSHKNPLILSLKINKAKLELKNSGFAVSAEIEPKCMHSSYTFLFGVVPAQNTAVGTHVEKTTQASLPIRVRVAYKQQENKWSVNIKPKPQHEVFYHKAEAKTFVSHVHHATTPCREWLETAKSIRNQQSTSKMEKRLTYKNLPVAAQISLETEEKLQDQKVLEKRIQKNGLIPTAIEIFQNPGLNAREVHINLESQEDESAFDYEWEMENQVEEEERSETPVRGQEQESADSEEDYYDSSEESHEDEVRDSLMGEIFSRVNSAIAGKPFEQKDVQKIRQNAGNWMRKTKQNMKWVEDYKDYESDEESWDERAIRQDQQRSQPEQNSCQTLKTQVVRDSGRVCFTTRPVLSCASSCQAESVKQVTMDFHCLPMSAFTTQLVNESERKILTQLAKKRVDFNRSIAAPVSCSA